MSERFALCFPSGGNMVCQHWNGNWIVFPSVEDYSRKQKTSPDREIIDEVSVQDKEV